MKATEIYERAIANGVELECTCVEIGYGMWELLMEGSTRANSSTVEKILVEQGHLNRDDVKLYNPYRHLKTEKHLIYVHSGIEHFFRIN